MNLFKKQTDKFISQTIDEAKKEIKTHASPIITSLSIIFALWVLLPEKSQGKEPEKQTIINNIYVYGGDYNEKRQTENR